MISAFLELMAKFQLLAILDLAGEIFHQPQVVTGERLDGPSRVSYTVS